MRGGSDDPVGLILGTLLELFQAYPVLGLIGSAVFAGLSLYIQRLPSSLLHGKVHLLLYVTWPFAFIALGVTVIGFVSQQRKNRQARARTSVEDLTALDRAGFVQLLGELYAQRGFEVLPAGAPADLALKKPGYHPLLLFADLQRMKEVGPGELEPFARTVAGWATPAEGLIATGGAFTQEAREYARDLPLMLVDGEMILQLIHVPPGPPEEQGAESAEAKTQ